MTRPERLLLAQRAARLAKEAEEKVRATQSALSGGGAQDFWDLVDSSSGLDACHPWMGYVDHQWATYPVGKFDLEGIATTLAHRIACFLVYGREVPRDMDVIPLCDNRLCCNVRHFMIVPHSVQDRMSKAVTAEEFFCNAIAA